MPEKWPEVSRSLRRAKSSAERRLAEIENERREIKASVRSLDAALKALSKAEDGDTRSPTKSAATIGEVIEMLTQVMDGRSGASIGELTKLVGRKLADAGRCRTGLKLQIMEALKGPRFTETSNGYELSDGKESAASNTETGQAEPRTDPES